MRGKLPISTRALSVFIPACSLPEAIMAGVMGSDGLMEATSNAGAAAGVCAKEHDSNTDARVTAIAQLTTLCMTYLLSPMQKPGTNRPTGSARPLLWI